MCCGSTTPAPVPFLAPAPRGVAIPHNSPLPQSAVTLHYLGSTPIPDLANVPTGARYRLRPDHTLLVYPADVETLMARLNEDDTPRFERFT